MIHGGGEKSPPLSTFRGVAIVSAVKDNFQYDRKMMSDFLQVEISDSEDNLLELMFEAAKEDADSICNNPFEDSDGLVSIPAAVKMWVLRRTARLWENRTSGIASEGDTTGNVVWKDDDYRDLLRYRIEPGFGT